MSGAWDRYGAMKIVVHHLGDGKGPATTGAELQRRANPPHLPDYPKGYDWPEYEWGILADGSIITMRPLTYVGAHCQADREKYQLGENWWNRNSVSIVIGNDNTKYPPTEAQVANLISFLVGWCKEKGTTFDDVYPHFQVTQTDCPGAVSQELGISSGAWMDWDAIGNKITAILDGTNKPSDQIQTEGGSDPNVQHEGNEKETQDETQSETEEEKVKGGIVAIFGPKDIMNGLALAEAKGCSVCLQSQTNVWKGCQPIYWVGGDPFPEPNPNVYNSCGADFKETTAKVLQEL